MEVSAIQMRFLRQEFTNFKFIKTTIDLKIYEKLFVYETIILKISSLYFSSILDCRLYCSEVNNLTTSIKLHHLSGRCKERQLYILDTFRSDFLKCYLWAEQWEGEYGILLVWK